MAESVSDTVTTTAPALLGVWVYDPLDPDGTERHFLHTTSRTVSVKPPTASIQLAGARNPLIEYGESTVVGVKVTITVPFDELHDSGVQWWLDMLEARRALNYRDNRGRLFWVAILDGVNPEDVREGTKLALSLQRVDYDESVA